MGLTSAQWVVNSYNACFAAFLVSAGSIADAIGRRRVYTFGVGLFFVSGMLCLFAQDITALLALRTLGGIGAAAAVAGGGSMLALAFEGPARARAFGLLGTVLGAGTAFGPAVAGMLVDRFIRLNPRRVTPEESASDPAALALDDSAIVAHRLFCSYLGTGHNGHATTETVRAMFAEARSGRELPSKGYGADMDYCSEIDVTTVVPHLEVQRRGGGEAFVVVAQGPGASRDSD